MSIDDKRIQHQKEVDENYKRFKDIFPSILDEHKNEYALMRKGEIIQYFTTYNDAIKAGDMGYTDEMYSVQKVEDENISLGYYSYA